MKKQNLVLVDTSSWIEMLRPRGISEIKNRVIDLLHEGRATLCEIILLELWHGAKGKLEREALSEMQRVLTCFKIDSLVWIRSWRLAQLARSSGLNCPTADLVIAACAFENGLDIEHNDKHLGLLNELRMKSL